MRVLVTGGTGFVGSHLVRACLAAGDTVFTTARSDTAKSDATILRCDVKDEAQVLAAIEAARPERVFHLAGHASAAKSFDAEEEVFRTNVLGTLHVLRAVKARAPGARVLYVGSTEEYGRVPQERQPIREEELLRPVSPYGVSRASASLVAQRYALAEGLFVVRTRSFNHTGAGQTSDYVAPSFAEQLVRARLAGRDRIEILTGDLSVRRDFSGVTGVVRAYRSLLERGVSGEVYNVCSGRAISMEELLLRLGEVAGVRAEARRDPARTRKVDLPVVVGDSSRMESVIGGSIAEALDEDLVGLVRGIEERIRRS